METNLSTTLEESIRKLRGISYILSSLSYSEELDPGQTDMYELLSRTIDDITYDLEPIQQELIELGK